MTLRHATALAFVGWYLLAPPAADWKRWHEQGPLRIRPGLFAFGFHAAPLPKWKKVGEFDSQGDCETNRALLVNRAGTTTSQSVQNAKQYKANHAMCVASDDPRLKIK